MMNAASRMSYDRTSWVTSTTLASGAIPNITPFIIPTKGSARPKSVVSVIMFGMRRVYLDSNATTPMRPEVVAAVMPVFTEHYGNASSIHWFGQYAKALMDDARQQVAKLINAEVAEVVFVSGGTEADNLAIRGMAESLSSKGRHIITSKIEHHAVLHTCRDLEKQGYEV